MDDEAVRIADEIEKALTQRISAVYGDALKKSIRMNRRFLQKIRDIDSGFAVGEAVLVVVSENFLRVADNFLVLLDALFVELHNLFVREIDFLDEKRGHLNVIAFLNH